MLKIIKGPVFFLTHSVYTVRENVLDDSCL